MTGSEVATRRGSVARRGAWRLGLPFGLLHLSCLAVLVVGWSSAALGACAAMYVLRAFGITAFYHRCFSHRAFRISRRVAFLGACLGASAAQRGPLWWAAHHRRHHRATDRPGDPHSPIDGVAHSHVLWMFAPANRSTDAELVADLASYPELRLLDRFHHVVPALTALGIFGIGSLMASLWPGAHTSGLQLLVSGFCISTVLAYQATFAVNSLGHMAGTRPFATTDDSHNSWWLAIVTLGEGWHNNHHRFPSGARAGFAPWQLDLTWLALLLLARIRLVHDLRPVPPRLLAAVRARSPVRRASRRRPSTLPLPDMRALVEAPGGC